MGTDHCAVDSLGHCFVCLTKIVQNEQTSTEIVPFANNNEEGNEVGGVPPSRKKYSTFQYPSHYLRIDKWKIFDRKRHLSQHKYEKARLKLELCSECHEINEMVTSLIVVLERAEMELTSRIRNIYQKMTDSDQKGITEKFLEFLGTSSMTEEKIEIVRKARMETISKCKATLKRSHPQVKLQRVIQEEGSKKVKTEDVKVEVVSKEIKDETDSDYGSMETDENPTPSTSSSSSSSTHLQLQNPKETEKVTLEESRGKILESNEASQELELEKKKKKKLETDKIPIPTRSTSSFSTRIANRKLLRSSNNVQQEAEKVAFRIPLINKSSLRKLSPRKWSNNSRSFNFSHQRRDYSETIKSSAATVAAATVRKINANPGPSSSSTAVNSSGWPCSFCPKHFSTKWNLNKHSYNFHPTEVFSGPSARRESVKNRKLQLDHQAKHHKCLKCLKAFWSLSGWKKHKLQGNCYLPSAATSTDSHKKGKVSNKSGERKTMAKVNCKTCGKLLPKSRLAGHMLQCNEMGMYKCKLCPKAYQRRSGLWKHNNRHHSSPDPEEENEEVKLFKCKLCPKEYYRRTSLWKHNKNHHTSPSSPSVTVEDEDENQDYQEERFTCNICKKVFTKLYKFTIHNIRNDCAPISSNDELEEEELPVNAGDRDQ